MKMKKNGNIKFQGERYQLKALDGHTTLDKLDFDKKDLIPIDSKEWRWQDIRDKHVCFVDRRLHAWLKAR